MLKKLTALSLALLLCLSLLPSQAGAMDASEEEPSIQAENLENQGSSENGDADAAPCTAVAWTDEGGGGPGLPIGPETYGNGKPYKASGGQGCP